MNVISIKDYKDKKKLQIIEEDILTSLELVALAYRGLSLFKKYKPISELLFELLNTKACLQNNLTKCRELIKNIK